MSLGKPDKEKIKDVVDAIDNGDFKLPNIQRPFVWNPDRLLQLLDSIMKGYPFGSITLWNPSDGIDIRVRDFIKDYTSGMKLKSNIADQNNFYLVLDGQQRLQSLYVSLVGSYDSKKVYFKLDANQDEPYFYLLNPDKVKNEFLIRPNELLKLKTKDKSKFLEKFNVDSVKKSLIEMNIDVFKEQFVIENLIYFLPPVENDVSIDEVVEIFIRVNSGGITLNTADLIFSTIVSRVSEFEDKFNDLLDCLNDNERFNFDISFLIKASLVIFGKGAKYDIKKLKDESYIEELYCNFGGFKDSLISTMNFVKNKMKIKNEKFLKSKNSLIPIIDWVYNQTHHQVTETEECKLKQYLYLVSNNQFFSYGADGKLDAIHKIVSDSSKFPLNHITDYLKERNYETDFSDDFLLTNHALVLNILEDGIELMAKKRGWSIEKDHIFPKSTLENLQISDNLINDIGNFRFLNKTRNILKSNKIPEKQLDFFGKNQNEIKLSYLHCIDYLQDNNLDKFKEEYPIFIKNRKKLMLSKIKGYLCI